jgi:hypothetical protein
MIQAYLKWITHIRMISYWSFKLRKKEFLEILREFQGNDIGLVGFLHYL